VSQHSWMCLELFDLNCTCPTIANYSMILNIFVFMNHRGTQGAKTSRESFYGWKLMDDTNKNDKLLMGDGATNEPISRSIICMLNNAVNLVKYDVLILLVVVMFFKPKCWSLCDTSVWDKININECINYCLWYSLPVKIIKKTNFNFTSLR
jgi:hypothetical protein